jgi:hypothetical protein
VSKDGHLFLQILAFAFRAARFAAAHHQGLKFLAAGAADKIK